MVIATKTVQWRLFGYWRYFRHKSRDSVSPVCSLREKGFFPTTCVEKETWRIFQYLISCQYLLLYNYTCQWRADLFSPWCHRSIRYFNNHGYQWTSKIRRQKERKNYHATYLPFWFDLRGPIVPVTGVLKFVYFGTPVTALIKSSESKNSCFSESQNIQLFR